MPCQCRTIRYKNTTRCDHSSTKVQQDIQHEDHVNKYIHSKPNITRLNLDKESDTYWDKHSNIEQQDYNTNVPAGTEGSVWV